MIVRVVSSSLVALAVACAPAPDLETQAPATATRTGPRGALIEPSGFATIRDAPPAPFAPVQPGEPPRPTPLQTAGQQQFARAGAFQNSVRDQVTALDARLRREEVGNYVSLYYDNVGEPSVVFQFLRNGPATLARYTSHPRFIGRTVRFSQGQLTAASEFMSRTFGEDRVIESTGIGRNTVTVRVSVPEPEFRALVARKGVTLPEPIELEFAATRPASAVNGPLSSDIASLVRIFPRDDRPAGPLHSIDSTAKVELRDGCFRIADRDGALVLFPLGTRLFIDREGYLAFGAEVPGYGRVGETLIFPGSIGEVTAPALAAPIRAACGPGRVVKINGTASAAAQRAQHAVTADSDAVRHFREAYGLSDAGARRAVDRCRQQSGAGFCPMSPPRPVSSQSECPAGTRLSHGLCRTPEGFIRPLPDWLKEFVDQDERPAGALRPSPVEADAEPSRQSLPVDQLEAMFRAAIAQARPSGPQRALCFGIDERDRTLGDPPEALRRRLAGELRLPGFPASQCSFDIYPYVTASRDRAMLYTVRIIEIENGGTIRFMAMATYGNLGAEGQEFRLVRRAGHWIPEPTGLRVIS